MATFPGAVKAFTTKSDGAGNKVFASHVNDLQDEVTAIEDGLRNASAQLNLGASTLAALSVTAGSSFGGVVNMTARPTMPPPEMALVYRASTFAAGSSAVNTISTITFNAEAFVQNSSMHSTASNSERLVPQTTGVYQFTGQISLAGAPGAATYLRARIVDSTGDAFAINDVPGMAIAGVLQVSGEKRFDAIGSYAVLQLQNVSGGSTLSLSSGIGLTWFSMVKL